MPESNYGQNYPLAENGTRADELAHFDRITSRRHFLATVGKGAALAGLGVFGAGPSCSGGPVQPAAGGIDPTVIGLPKPDMIVHSQHPFNGEFPPHLLAADVTPTARHFVRNNGSIPERGWSLTVDGEVRSQRAFSLDDLHSLPQVTLQVVLECAGNGRSSFAPTVGGTQWIRGAVACSEWTGVRLRDVLQAAEVTEKAVYLANYGEDAPPFSGAFPFRKPWTSTP
ncbi:MAG: molybdopterin-dependent oxidoreductase [Candidatus Latescibacteria bacterium]|nr:molybdopterin-dependent oxidoreductase [Candidatus Latescibacterota bacterium]